MFEVARPFGIARRPSNIEDNICYLKIFLNHATSTICWIIVERAPSCPCLGRVVLEPVTLIASDNFNGSGGTVFTSFQKVMKIKAISLRRWLKRRRRTMFIGIIPGFIKLCHIKIGVVGRVAKCTPLSHPINALNYLLYS